jgi:hypothetical protein
MTDKIVIYSQTIKMRLILLSKIEDWRLKDADTSRFFTMDRCDNYPVGHHDLPGPVLRLYNPAPVEW